MALKKMAKHGCSKADCSMSGASNDLKNFHIIKKNFLKYYKFPTPLFTDIFEASTSKETHCKTSLGKQKHTMETHLQPAEKKMAAKKSPIAAIDSNPDFIKEVLRTQCRSNTKREITHLQRQFDKMKLIMRTQYKRVTPISPISSPVKRARCWPIRYSADGLFKIPHQPVLHRVIYKEEAALAEGTIVSSIERQQNPFASNKPSDLHKLETQVIEPLCYQPSFNDIHVKKLNNNIEKDYNANDMNWEREVASTNEVSSSVEINQYQSQLESQSASQFRVETNRWADKSITQPLKITLRKNRLKNTYEVVK